MHHLHTVFIVGSSPTVTTSFRIATANIKNLFLKKSQKMLSCFIVGALCNGSTTDFESVSLGSIPSAPAKLYRVRIVENTQSYEVWNGGSIPSRDTNLWCL